MSMFYISVDLSTIYFIILVAGELPLCAIVTIIEYCVMFSGVKLSIRSFNLFMHGDKTDLNASFRYFSEGYFNFFVCKCSY